MAEDEKKDDSDIFVLLKKANDNDVSAMKALIINYASYYENYNLDESFFERAEKWVFKLIEIDEIEGLYMQFRLYDFKIRVLFKKLKSFSNTKDKEYSKVLDNYLMTKIKRFDCCKKGAEKDILETQIKLINIYLRDDEAQYDPKKAVEIINKLISEDDRTSAPLYLILGRCYIRGTGVEEDKNKGIEILKKYSSPKFSLGFIYLSDAYLGMYKDEKKIEYLQEAFDWLKKAKEYVKSYTKERQLASLSNFYMAVVSSYDEKLYKKFSAKENLLSTLEEFLDVSIDSANALFDIGTCYMLGIGCDLDYDKGYDYQVRAVNMMPLSICAPGAPAFINLSV